jgi:hypothetical protein
MDGWDGMGWDGGDGCGWDGMGWHCCCLSLMDG